MRLLEILPDWLGLVSRFKSIQSERSLAIIVCGPKGAGKSTFCRILANALLQKAPVTEKKDLANDECVAFLDLDPGQPEYSPPGDLSLLRLRSWNLGPPFTHPTFGLNQLVRAHHFGHISPREDPKNYLQLALDLLDHYRRMAKAHRSCPLIINSAGWIQGIGLELISELILSLNLTDAIYMSTLGPEDVVDTLREATGRSNATLHQLVSQSSDFMTRTAADFRMMQTLSYFHMGEAEGSYNEMRWKPRSLTTVAPLVIHYAGPKQAILALAILGDAPNVEFLDSFLDGLFNGCVVGVVAVGQSIGAVDREYSSAEGVEEYQNMIEQDSDIPDPPPIQRTTSEMPYLSSSNHHTTSLLSPKRSHSLGQALIRGIDPTAKTIHLLTPIPTRTLQTHSPHIVLVRGTLDTPTWAYKEDFELAKAKRRVRERRFGTDEGGGGGGFDAEETRKWAERQPWAGLVDGGKRRRSSGKVRRVRRDIRYRPVGEASSE